MGVHGKRARRCVATGVAARSRHRPRCCGVRYAAASLWGDNQGCQRPPPTARHVDCTRNRLPTACPTACSRLAASSTRAQHPCYWTSKRKVLTSRGPRVTVVFWAHDKGGPVRQECSLRVPGPSACQSQRRIADLGWFAVRLNSVAFRMWTPRNSPCRSRATGCDRVGCSRRAYWWERRSSRRW